MSEDIVVRVEDLTKVYKLYNSPVDRLKESLHPFRKQFHHDFYALNDVSFDIKRSESVGIIGRNGSGKSSLLKTLAGVLTPTSGNVAVNGKVSALLELGAGFNPELSGIENVYFNGMLMGYSREEMDERLDNILAFADIPEFVLQPVKTYSSGMFVRLAFAVAVSVNPDILIVDEALSVGDALFQQRCVARIRSMIDSGVTLLFVSHAPDMIRALCDKGIWLENGRIRMIDDAVKVSNAYQHAIYIENNKLRMERVLQPEDGSDDLHAGHVNADIIKQATSDITSTKDIRIHHVHVENSCGRMVDALHQGEEFQIVVQLSSGVLLHNLSVGILIKDGLGLDLTGESNFNKFRKGITLKQGEVATVTFKSKMLLSGGHDYAVALTLNSVSKWDRSDHILLYRDDAAAIFKVIQDLNEPMWFKFYQDFEVTVDVK